MSMNFNKDLTESQQEFIKHLFEGSIEVMDKRQVLLKSGFIDQGMMKAVANQVNQVVTVELHGQGDVKTMSDGTRYQVTKKGGKKLDDKEAVTL